jgi:hypothetical protein
MTVRRLLRRADAPRELRAPRQATEGRAPSSAPASQVRASKPKQARRLVLNAVQEADGYTFSLDYESEQRARALNPDPSTPNRVFVGFDLKAPFETFHERIARFVLPLLTGLAPDRIAELGVSFRDSWNDRPLGEWPLARPAAKATRSSR